MMEEVRATRRSRRAASLTAQVLWSMQMEEDSNSNKDIGEPENKISLLEEIDPTFGSKRGRKRSTSDRFLPWKILRESFDRDAPCKKRKLSTGYSGNVFPVARSIQTKKDAKSCAKLVASVAPLVQPPTTLSETAVKRTATNTTSSNEPSIDPILLLPVSLRANQVTGQMRPNMGSLSLLTFQATPDFLNCFGLNKALVHASNDKGLLASSNDNAKSYNPHVHLNAKDNVISTTTLTNLGKRPLNSFRNFLENALHSDWENSHSDLLNLKMGETTIPNSSREVELVKPNAVHAHPSKKTTVTCVPEKNKVRTSTEGSISSLNADTIGLKQTKAKKPQRKISRSNPVNKQTFQEGCQTTPSNGELQTKCPSPDYSCSSPDVDDVQKDPRHSCNRRHINLRKRAAPPANSQDYQEFVKEQKRILAQLKRSQKAKARAKSRNQAAKQEKLKRIKEKKERAIVSLPFQEESNNGWQWAGKPYTCLVFSVEEGGKYVRRCCYPGMIRKNREHGITDVVLVRDCVFLRPGGDDELPYVAKVSALWEKPGSGDMMMSLVWYYRPEHTEDVKLSSVSAYELFSSRHQDEMSVACVEERCSVLTYLQFCRFHAELRRDGTWNNLDLRRIVPKMTSFKRPMFSRESRMNQTATFFSRYFYEIHQKKIRSKLPAPLSLCPDRSKRNTSALM